MTFSRLERTLLVATLLVIAFMSGWFFSRRHEESLIFVPPSEAPVLSPSPSAIPDRAPAVSSGGSLININTADAELLQTLPGIGEKRAADIIAYRETYGPFRFPEEVFDVPGIGPVTYDGIIDRITVED